MPYTYNRNFKNLLVLGLAGFVSIVSTSPQAFAEQSFNQVDLNSAIDPFDPSETVNHTLKDDIRLRLRLPAPDLPPSIIASVESHTTEISTHIDSGVSSKTKTPQTLEDDQPGLIDRSIKSVMSVFDWSWRSNEVTQKASPANSEGPIRINVHVGIEKPNEQTAQPTEEVSSLGNPLSRNQERIRRLFTFDKIKTYN